MHLALSLNTPERLMVMAVMATMSATIPVPGTGIRFPAAAPAAQVWMILWQLDSWSSVMIFWFWQGVDSAYRC